MVAVFILCLWSLPGQACAWVFRWELKLALCPPPCFLCTEAQALSWYLPRLGGPVDDRCGADPSRSTVLPPSSKACSTHSPQKSKIIDFFLKKGYGTTY